MIVKRARDVKRIEAKHKLNGVFEFEHTCHQLKCQFLVKPIPIRIHERRNSDARVADVIIHV